MSQKEKPIGIVKPELVYSPGSDVEALFSKFDLNDSNYQPFRRHKTPGPERELDPVPISPGRAAALRVGVFSPMGGSGASTLTASIGSIFCRIGRQVLLVDTSPWPALIFHFGATEPQTGKRTFFAPGSESVRITVAAVNEDSPNLHVLEDAAAAESVDCLIIDLRGHSGEALRASLRSCKVVLVPLLPDPSTLRLAKAVKLMISNLGASAPRLQFVLNQMDDSEEAMQVQAHLIRTFGEYLFPHAIRRQIEVHDAITNGVPLPFFAPESQATGVCNEIVHWLEKQVAVKSLPSLRWSER